MATHSGVAACAASMGARPATSIAISATIAKSTRQRAAKPSICSSRSGLTFPLRPLPEIIRRQTWTTLEFLRYHRQTRLGDVNIPESVQPRKAAVRVRMETNPTPSTLRRPYSTRLSTPAPVIEMSFDTIISKQHLAWSRRYEN